MLVALLFGVFVGDWDDVDDIEDDEDDVDIEGEGADPVLLR